MCILSLERAAGGADRARHQQRPGVDVAAACSRPPSACRSCRSRRACARSRPSARRTCRRDSSARRSSLVVKGNFARSSSSRDRRDERRRRRMSSGSAARAHRPAAACPSGAQAAGAQAHRTLAVSIGSSWSSAPMALAYAQPSRAMIARPITQSLSSSVRNGNSSVKWVTRCR